ncbi:MAG TPA: hypothetical protein VGQ41_06100, partial [Pyrinomonadaceae bacterium]|nr:hypothetical protein [Pyrinomonadaceae bacterium]
MLRSYQRSLLRTVVSALMVLVFAVTSLPARPRTHGPLEISAVKEGAGYSPVRGNGLNYSFYRDLRPAGRPKDTNDNATDFMWVVSEGEGIDGQILGAPGAENLSSPLQQNANFVVSLVAPCTGA